MLRDHGHRCIALSIDWIMSPLSRLRPATVARASGRVLEVGAGTGLNFAHYTDAVTEVVAIEPDPHMRRRALGQATRAPVPVRLHPHGAESLPFPDGHFDDVVATWVFCTIPDVPAAMAELHRVLRPGGAVHFIEHTACRHEGLHSVQRAINPVWRRFAGGCQLVRHPTERLRDAGFVIDDVRPIGPEVSLWPMHAGTAIKR